MATARARTDGKPSIVLCDYTRAAIQSQEAVAALQRVVAAPKTQSRRVALHAEGRLATMQARRVATMRDDIRVFDDRRSAFAWLMA